MDAEHLVNTLFPVANETPHRDAMTPGRNEGAINSSMRETGQQTTRFDERFLELENVEAVREAVLNHFELVAPSRRRNHWLWRRSTEASTRLRRSTD
jgi:hypothetical protein